MLRILHTLGIMIAFCLAALSQDQQGDIPLGDLARAARKSHPVIEQKAIPNNGEAPLGDVARAARKSKPVIEERVIDNDNFAAMMDKAESARLNGQPVFSIDPGGRTFRMTSPDGTCSLSFDAKSGVPNSAAYIASDLPQDELLKLEGPAAVHDDEIQV